MLGRLFEQCGENREFNNDNDSKTTLGIEDIESDVDNGSKTTLETDIES